jgi:hypothetical protein
MLKLNFDPSLKIERRFTKIKKIKKTNKQTNNKWNLEL